MLALRRAVDRFYSISAGGEAGQMEPPHCWLVVPGVPAARSRCSEEASNAGASLAPDSVML